MSSRDEFLDRRGMLVRTGLTEEEILNRILRTEGDCICNCCGKMHRDHPYIDEARNWEDDPYLHLLCDGTLAKL